MNVILVSRNGVLDTPILVKNDITAEAVFENLVEELLGEDADELNLFSDTAIDHLNHLLEGTGIEVSWFVDVDVNKYKN